MRIALPNYSGYIFQHFGRSEEFRIYDVDDTTKQITNVQTLSTEGRHHGQLAGWLHDLGVNVVICGGIGQGMQQLLANLGISFFGGVTGSCDKAVNDFLHGQLLYVENPGCSDETAAPQPDEADDREKTSDEREADNADSSDGQMNPADGDEPQSALEAYHDANGKLHMPLMF